MYFRKIAFDCVSFICTRSTEKSRLKLREEILKLNIISRKVIRSLHWWVELCVPTLHSDYIDDEEIARISIFFVRRQQWTSTAKVDPEM